ncbi:hypothetical protein Tco_1497944, partial [Tanacetum coccineum]
HIERPKGNLKQLKTIKVNEPKLKDIPVVREFPGVFLEDLSGLPPSREVEKEWMKPRRARSLSMTIHFSIKAKIMEAQSEASKDINTPAKMFRGLDKQFKRKEDGGLYFVERIWVPAYGNLRTLIMNEAHVIKYSVHPGADKMYYDL